MQLHTLTTNTKNRKPARVGRGGKRGKTSGRGQKGAGARAGNRSRPEWRDTIKRLPKRRGFGKNRARGVVGSRVKPVSLSLSVLEKYFEVGETVAPATLLDKKLITRLSSREGVKVLGTGTLSKKLTFKGVSVSGSARSAIEKAGGTIS